jgi:hypothetical protein
MAQCADHAVRRLPRPRTSRGQRSLVLVDVGGVAEKKQIADLVEPDAGVHHADAGDDNR